MRMRSRDEGEPTTDDVLQLAAERARSYVEQVGERRVGPSEKEVTGLAKFREAFPEGASDPRSVVAMLDEFGSPATVASTGGRYFGYVIGGVLPAALGANWLAGVWDQNVPLGGISPIWAEREDVRLTVIIE